MFKFSRDFDFVLKIWLPFTLGHPKAGELKVGYSVERNAPENGCFEWRLVDLDSDSTVHAAMNTSQVWIRTGSSCHSVDPQGA